MEENRLVILTAAHVLADAADNVSVAFIDGKVVNCSDYICFPKSDIGVVYIDLSLFTEEQKRLYKRVNVDMACYDNLSDGDGCILFGSRTGVATEAYEGKILSGWTYMEDYNQYMIWVKGYAMEGMSGGGLFDYHGHFLGILSGYTLQEDVAVVPLAVVENVLKTANDEK